MKRCAWLAPVLLLASCAGEANDVLSDDIDDGDSLAAAADGKADSRSTVPTTLGLDKHKIVYLTFDDGPSAALTPQILDILAKHHAHATFFITGLNIAGNEALLRRERDEGHHVGNHQWKHVIASSSQFTGWVTQERDLLHSIVGDMPMYFRYPYGAGSGAKEVVLKAQGYLDGGVGWDIDSLDWDFGGDETSMRPEVPSAYRHNFEGWIFYQLDRRGGGVVLMHDIQSITARHLDSILTQMEQRGYRFGMLPDRRSFIGEPCSADGECAVPGGFCLDDVGGGVCTQHCTSSCPDAAGHAATRCVRASDGRGAQMDVCAAQCGAGGACAAGLSCTSLTSPSGAPRSVCW